MPATKFICPDGKRNDIADCLCSCPNQQRCMFLPTLRAVAKSFDRQISEPTVTELIAGTRETFLKETSNYAVDPASVLYALHGQAVHSINERHTQGSILSEERLKDEITSGQFDLFGKILDSDDGVLGDLKVTSSFKLMKALGFISKRLTLAKCTSPNSKRVNLNSALNFVMTVCGICSTGLFNSMLIECYWNEQDSKSIVWLSKLCVGIQGFALLLNAVSLKAFTSFQSTKSATIDSNVIFSTKQKHCATLSTVILFRLFAPSVNAGLIVNVLVTARLVRTVPMLKNLLLRRRKATMNPNSLLRLFSHEYDAKTNSISPHVRYISPDNVLNCELVTCTEIEVNRKLFDVWSDDMALLKDKPAPNLYIDDDLIIFGSVAFAKADEEGKLVGLSSDDVQLLWDFALAQFPKLLNFLRTQRR